MKLKITRRTEISGKGKEMPNLYCLVSNNTMTIDFSSGRPKCVYPFTFTNETFQLNNVGHIVIPLEVDTSVGVVKIVVNEMTCDFPGKDFDYRELSPFLRLQFKLRMDKENYLFDLLYDYSISQLLPSGETKLLYRSNWKEIEEKNASAPTSSPAFASLELKGERRWSLKETHSFSLVDGKVIGN